MAKLEYIGRGAALPGVPARDLSAEEVEVHGGEKKLIKTGLYRPAREPGKPAKKDGD